MASTYRPKQFYCAKPIVPSCHKGFTTQAALAHHQNSFHNVHSRRTRPCLNPFQGANSEPPHGSYYTIHPIMDGKMSSNIIGAGH